MPPPSRATDADVRLLADDLEAIEASLGVLMQIILRRDFHFPGPLLETPKHWIVHGFDEDLNVANRQAALGMLGLLSDHVGLSRPDAYSLMSVAADFAVTQVVDGRQGGVLLSRLR